MLSHFAVLRCDGAALGYLVGVRCGAALALLVLPYHWGNIFLLLHQAVCKVIKYIFEGLQMSDVF